MQNPVSCRSSSAPKPKFPTGTTRQQNQDRKPKARARKCWHDQVLLGAICTADGGMRFDASCCEQVQDRCELLERRRDAAMVGEEVRV
eukprot:235734-Rhodomonas_salina.2